MNLEQFEKEFSKIKSNFKTKDLDLFSKQLIKNNTDVSFLKDIILQKQQYHRIYFQVSLSKLKTIDEKLSFIEDNFHNLNDWWHVDQLTQFIDKYLTFEIAFNKAKEYINNPHPFARRFGYVLFMPSLVKLKEAKEYLFSLFKDDKAYYVQMAQAWLLSYLGIYYPQETIDYLKNCNLNYNIVGKAIQKICDSFRISNYFKLRFKDIRTIYKNKN